MSCEYSNCKLYDIIDVIEQLITFAKERAVYFLKLSRFERQNSSQDADRFLNISDIYQRISASEIENVHMRNWINGYHSYLEQFKKINGDPRDDKFTSLRQHVGDRITKIYIMMANHQDWSQSKYVEIFNALNKLNSNELCCLLTLPMSLGQIPGLGEIPSHSDINIQFAAYLLNTVNLLNDNDIEIPESINNQVNQIKYGLPGWNKYNHNMNQLQITTFLSRLDQHFIAFNNTVLDYLLFINDYCLGSYNSIRDHDLCLYNLFKQKQISSHFIKLWSEPNLYIYRPLLGGNNGRMSTILLSGYITTYQYLKNIGCGVNAATDYIIGQYIYKNNYKVYKMLKTQFIEEYGHDHSDPREKILNEHDITVEIDEIIIERNLCSTLGDKRKFVTSAF